MPPPSNRPPTVRITSPANGATFANPKRITITADAADRGGTVARVDFYRGGRDSPDGAWRVWLGQACRAPYAVTWEYDPSLEYDPAGGTLILTARATDNRGAVREHSVTITVSGKKGPPRHPSAAGGSRRR